jgi:transcriptional regulator with XRE-family HTH domain
MITHWTERSARDYIFAIGADFVSQLEDKMEDEGISQNALSERLGITKGRVSQVFNRPGNITLGNIVKYARALGIKASIVAYDDGDIENKKGPINSKVFQACWEQCRKPHDFWDLEQTTNCITFTGSMLPTWQDMQARAVENYAMIMTVSQEVTAIYGPGENVHSLITNQTSPIPDSVYDYAVAR